MVFWTVYLSKKGPLGKIWLAATYEKSLNRYGVLRTNITEAAKMIESGIPVEADDKDHLPISVRISGFLYFGLVKIFSRKVRYLFDDVRGLQTKINMAFQSTTIDLPSDVTVASRSHITLPETSLEDMINMTLTYDAVPLTRQIQFGPSTQSAFFTSPFQDSSNASSQSVMRKKPSREQEETSLISGINQENNLLQTPFLDPSLMTMLGFTDAAGTPTSLATTGMNIFTDNSPFAEQAVDGTIERRRTSGRAGLIADAERALKRMEDLDGGEQDMTMFADFEMDDAQSSKKKRRMISQLTHSDSALDRFQIAEEDEERRNERMEEEFGEPGTALFSDGTESQMTQNVGGGKEKPRKEKYSNLRDDEIIIPDQIFREHNQNTAPTTRHKGEGVDNKTDNIKMDIESRTSTFDEETTSKSVFEEPLGLRLKTDSISDFLPNSFLRIKQPIYPAFPREEVEPGQIRSFPPTPSAVPGAADGTHYRNVFSHTTTPQSGMTTPSIKGVADGDQLQATPFDVPGSAGFALSSGFTRRRQLMNEDVAASEVGGRLTKGISDEDDVDMATFQTFDDADFPLRQSAPAGRRLTASSKRREEMDQSAAFGGIRGSHFDNAVEQQKSIAEHEDGILSPLFDILSPPLENPADRPNPSMSYTLPLAEQQHQNRFERQPEPSVQQFDEKTLGLMHFINDKFEKREEEKESEEVKDDKKKGKEKEAKAKREGSDDPLDPSNSMKMSEVIVTQRRRTLAYAFAGLLTLNSTGYIKMMQNSPLGDISINRTPRLQQFAQASRRRVK
ncbi:Sister chromatid cohesion protein 1 [Monocercomonoides exilis]|uniref:Sister chromatid cohesion protein 1 n=1 Tax=Monocercomonoides exilis TaxID=2049356 RepID=UPI00355A971B|nr:Sister chromatid cohesion protein 1 [Monocercomonoides exilis]|eukprot:MONOS_2768.1-p1 / transcript=MONOS_2768.1 / gene=MONOS_2768 / organism=Monocercomonoides_exilis_PA203 / gene_product=Sister chromatid cohesion protein 1 homolog / transcript_product=Sister chromatid cohesion protein 1 homolog / location=Mono_scaffold00059:50549-53318(+) / protein_length=790 / sequence_SO=supercontig / SO=protein_coding / is_pseudo=false